MNLERRYIRNKASLIYTVVSDFTTFICMAPEVGFSMTNMFVNTVMTTLACQMP